MKSTSPCHSCLSREKCAHHGFVCLRWKRWFSLRWAALQTVFGIPREEKPNNSDEK